MAARLSEDPGVRVILLEAGPPDTDMWIHIPAGYARLFASQKYDWKFGTEAEPSWGTAGGVAAGEGAWGVGVGERVGIPAGVAA